MSNIKSILQDELNRGSVLVVKFTKSNGEKRVMRCTRNMSLIPAPPVTEDKSDKPQRKPRKQPEGVAVVWDLEKSDWRSFRHDSVESVIVVEE